MDNTYELMVKNFSKDLGITSSEAIELYYIFLDELKNESIALSDVFQNNDVNMLKRIVHNIKGLTASYKLEKIFMQATKIDSLLKNQFEAGSLILELINDINHEVEGCLNYFKLLGK
jgi:HPt (histidine-containing phosphotransfer) domain-containing protein